MDTQSHYKEELEQIQSFLDKAIEHGLLAEVVNSAMTTYWIDDNVDKVEALRRAFYEWDL